MLQETLKYEVLEVTLPLLPSKATNPKLTSIPIEPRFPLLVGHTTAIRAKDWTLPAIMEYMTKQNIHNWQTHINNACIPCANIKHTRTKKAQLGQILLTF